MRKCKRQSGMVLLMAMACVLLMVLFAGMMLEPIRSEVDAADSAKREMAAFYAAEAGIESAIADLIRSGKPLSKKGLALDKATVSYEIAGTSKPGRYRVTARGVVPGPADRSSVIVVTAEVAIHREPKSTRAEVIWEHVKQ